MYYISTSSQHLHRIVNNIVPESVNNKQTCLPPPHKVFSQQNISFRLTIFKSINELFSMAMRTIPPPTSQILSDNSVDTGFEKHLIKYLITFVMPSCNCYGMAIMLPGFCYLTHPKNTVKCK